MNTGIKAGNTVPGHKKFCVNCFVPVSPNWNQRYCPNCGGRVKPRLAVKSGVSGVRPAEPEPFPPEKTVFGPRFHVLPPGALFIQNVLSLGLRGAFWLMNRIQLLFMTAKPEENNITGTLLLWISSFCAYLALLAFAVFNFAAGEAGIAAYLAESFSARFTAVMFVTSFVINRHILFWTREVVIDELSANGRNARPYALSFASSSLLIWFVGVPYIQFCANRVIRRRAPDA